MEGVREGSRLGGKGIQTDRGAQGTRSDCREEGSRFTSHVAGRYS